MTFPVSICPSATVNFLNILRFIHACSMIKLCKEVLNFWVCCAHFA